jgi:hypothetical protein
MWYVQVVQRQQRAYLLLHDLLLLADVGDFCNLFLIHTLELSNEVFTRQGVDVRNRQGERSAILSAIPYRLYFGTTLFRLGFDLHDLLVLAGDHHLGLFFLNLLIILLDGEGHRWLGDAHGYDLDAGVVFEAVMLERLAQAVVHSVELVDINLLERVHAAELIHLVVDLCGNVHVRGWG